MNNIYGIICSFIFVAAVLGLSTLLSKRGIIRGEGSRKLIHIGVCNWWIIAMVFYDNPFYAALVPAVFIAVNYMSYKKQLIKAMERNGGKKDLGTVYYAVSLFILALLSFGPDGEPYIGAIGILVMGYGDGIAAIIGERLGRIPFGPKKSGKTLEGTIGMFLASFIVVFMIMSIFSDISPLWVSLAIALYGAVAELYTPNGFDNLTVPLGTAFLYTIIASAV
ncbi:diacylglycerol/polyprenol kinase family protein [Alloiococcus sp. CFN-8]|uniref:diacylglycerol/polyprenol kinase family protein n=1 Tax=Alloiococcus sp. CFN-8 TaxID=3416081 RepID=UPI003CF487A2